MDEANGTAGQDDRATIARLADEMLPTLIERLTNSELGELEVRQDGWRIRLRRPLPASNGVEATSHAAPASGHWLAGVSSHHAGESQPARREPPRGLVTSVGVGYFSVREGVSVGASLRKGDVIGHVDVLGVRQEVASPADGVLRALDVENGQAVEYGQPIGRVEASVQ